MEADRAEVREPRRGRPDHRHGVVGVAALPHDRVGRDEPPWPRDADRNPGLHRTSGLAFRDPPRVRLEYREGPLAVRDRPDPERAAVNPGGLPHRMRHAGSDGVQCRYIDAACLRFRKGSLRAQHRPAAQGQAPPHIVRLGAAGHPDRREPLPHPLRQVPPPAPIADTVLRRHAGRPADHAAHRVPERDGIRGMADIGLRQEGVTAPGQGRARLFSRDRMAALHAPAAGLRRQLRVRELHTVHEVPVLVAVPVPNIRVFGELPDRVVPGHQLLQAVEIASRALPHDAHTRDAPHPVPGRPTRLSVPGGMCLSKSANRRDRKVLSLDGCRRPGSNAGMSSLDLVSISISPMSAPPSFIRRLRTYLMSTSGGITENDLFLAETARNRRPGPNLRFGNIPVCGMESSG